MDIITRRLLRRWRHGHRIQGALHEFKVNIINHFANNRFVALRPENSLVRNQKETDIVQSMNCEIDNATEFGAIMDDF